MKKNEMNEKSESESESELKKDDRPYESYYVSLLWSYYGLIMIISSFILAILSILRQNNSPKIKIQEKMLFWLSDCPQGQLNCTR